MNKIITHYWINEFGWENTIFNENDFKEFEILGENKEGIIWLGIGNNGKKHILKGYCEFTT